MKKVYEGYLSSLTIGYLFAYFILHRGYPLFHVKITKITKGLFFGEVLIGKE